MRGYRPPPHREYGPNDGKPPEKADELAKAKAIEIARMQSAQEPDLGAVGPMPGTDAAASAPPHVDKDFERRLLSSYAWDPPNSCFFDTGLEVWFRVYCCWPLAVRDSFLQAIPANDALSSIFHHFQRRLRWIEGRGEAAASSVGKRELQLVQATARHLIFDKWKILPTGAYGCAFTWMVQAIRVKAVHVHFCGSSNTDASHVTAGIRLHRHHYTDIRDTAHQVVSMFH